MSDHPAIRENNTMTEAELLLRAREAYIATKRPPRIVARCIRRGWADRLVRPAITALRDINRPLWLILEERDGATAAIILRTMLLMVWMLTACEVGNLTFCKKSR